MPLRASLGGRPVMGTGSAVALSGWLGTSWLTAHATTAAGSRPPWWDFGLNDPTYDEWLASLRPLDPEDDPDWEPTDSEGDQ